MFPSFLSGTKNNTRAEVGAVVQKVRSPRSASQHVTGIKNNTRAVKESSGIR